MRTEKIDVSNFADLPKGYSIKYVESIDNILKDKQLMKLTNKQNEQGEKYNVYDFLHEYVAPGLKPDLASRQKQRKEQNNKDKKIDIEQGICYLVDDKGDVISMASGYIDKQDNSFTIVNTATLHSKRKQGLITKVVKGLVAELYNNGYKTLNAFMDTNVAKDGHKKQIELMETNFSKKATDINKQNKIQQAEKLFGINMSVPIKELLLADNAVLSEFANEIINAKQSNMDQKVTMGGVNQFHIVDRVMDRYKNIGLNVKLNFDDKKFNDFYLQPQFDLEDDKNVKNCQIF